LSVRARAVRGSRRRRATATGVVGLELAEDRRRRGPASDPRRGAVEAAAGRHPHVVEGRPGLARWLYGGCEQLRREASRLRRVLGGGATARPLLAHSQSAGTGGACQQWLRVSGFC